MSELGCSFVEPERNPNNDSSFRCGSRRRCALLPRAYARGLSGCRSICAPGISGISRFRQDLRLRDCLEIKDVKVDRRCRCSWEMRRPYYAARTRSTLDVVLVWGQFLVGHWGRKRWKGWVPRRVGRGWGIETVVAAAEYDGGNSGHDRLRLDMQVAVHFVGVPSPDKANAIRVNTATQHGHSTAGASRSRGNIASREVGERRRKKLNSPAEKHRNIGGGDVLPRRGQRRPKGIKRGGRHRAACAATGQRVGCPLRP